MGDPFRKRYILPVVCALLVPSVGFAAGKIAAVLTLKDSLTSLNQPATVEVRLVDKGLLANAGLGGEPVELLINGKVVATAMTGGDGRAIMFYTPAKLGIVPLQVRVGTTPRVGAVDAEAVLAVWERRSPIVMVEVASLTEVPPTKNPLPGISLTGDPERKPMPDAADEIAKLTRFLYRVIYVTALPAAGADGFQAAAETRGWLKANKFPPGFVLVLPPGDEALGGKLDELHAAGWKTIKTGIGRTRAFAEAFLQRRLEAIVVPEPAKGDVPRKAKVAKEWKEVRKNL